MSDAIFGKYLLHRRLAVGGMAEVFLASRAGAAGFCKKVALKRILPHLSRDAAFVKLFIDEAVLAGRINHPHVVQVYDFGQVDGDYFIAMEWVDGLDLNELLTATRQCGRVWRAGEVAAVGEAVARGLAYAHSLTDDAGAPLALVHRDISPHNVMISRAGACKVTDFGVAKAAVQARSSTSAGLLKGKLAYMAPEQARGEPVHQACDQFALGLVLWELLTQERYYPESNTAALWQRVVAAEPQPLALRRTDLPAALVRVVERLLAPLPHERFGNMQEVASALAHLRPLLPVTTEAHLAALVAQLAPVPGVVAARMQEEAAPWALTRLVPAPAAPVRVERAAAQLKRLPLLVRARWPGRRVARVAAGAAAALLLGLAAVRWAAFQRPPHMAPEAGAALAPTELGPAVAAASTPPQEAATPSARGIAAVVAQQPPVAAALRSGASPAGAAYLSVRSAGTWFAVYRAGQFLGYTPLARVALPPGPTSVRLVNPVLGQERHFEVRLTAGEELRLTVPAAGGGG